MTASPALRRLRTRPEFLRAARGRRVGRSAFALQCTPNRRADAGVGFTVSKKVGNSPERNRIRRRLRAVAHACARDFAAGNDYVLIGRREALYEPFADLVATLRQALARVHAPKAQSSSEGTGGSPGYRNARS